MLTACDAPSSSSSEVSSAIESMEDLRVSSTFEWKTTKEVKLTFEGYKTSMIQIGSDNGIVYHKAFIQEGKPYTFTLTVPAHVNQLNAVYRGQKRTLDMNRSAINHRFESNGSN